MELLALIWARAVAPFLRAARWAGKWWFLLRERRRKVLSSAAVIAAELDYNADVILDAAAGKSCASTGRDHMDEWKAHQWELHAFAKAGHKDLWEEVVPAYQTLQRTKDRGLTPPSGEWLKGLGAASSGCALLASRRAVFAK